MSGPTTTYHDAGAAARALQALTLRKAGVTYPRIAQQCGYADKASAFNAVQRELKRHLGPVAEDVLSLELARLDDLLVVFHAKAMRGDAGAALLELRIMERRSKYLGLDKQPDASASASITIVEIDAAIAQGV